MSWNRALVFVVAGFVLSCVGSSLGCGGAQSIPAAASQMERAIPGPYEVKVEIVDNDGAIRDEKFISHRDFIY